MKTSKEENKYSKGKSKLGTKIWKLAYHCSGRYKQSQTQELQ